MRDSVCFQVFQLLQQQCGRTGDGSALELSHENPAADPAHWPVVSHVPESELCFRGVSRPPAGGEAFRPLLVVRDVLPAARGWADRAATEPAAPIQGGQILRLA